MKNDYTYYLVKKGLFDVYGYYICQEMLGSVPIHHLGHVYIDVIVKEIFNGIDGLYTKEQQMMITDPQIICKSKDLDSLRELAMMEIL